MLARLYGLGRLHPVQRMVVLWLVCATAVGIGVAALAGQRHFSAELNSGADLNVVATLVGDGSSPRTAWPGWLAAVFFGLALLRLWRGRPEPPAGRPPGGRWTAADIRSALRREYGAVRTAIIVLAVVAIIDGARAAVYTVAAATGDRVARGSVLATIVEALGLVLAAVMLTLWGLIFARLLERWGAL
ncbi:MAG: hypothetical protein E6I76_19585 [Chloroflexi bacterium]|nr:MAG: hypothetical protein E6I76_19585 [Chloroflexota bacterium]